MIQQYQLVEQIFAGNSEMAMLMRSHDWSRSALGAVETWPQSLRTIVPLVLNSRFPMVIWWGKELVLLYNDAWLPILGTKHPKALGRPGQEVWSEIWDIIGVQLESVLETAQATWSDDTLLLVDRYGYTEEAFFTYSYSPIFLETGEVGGAFTAVTETTRRVIGERRLTTLRELAASTAEAKSVEDTCRIASATLANNPFDIPFALLYLVEQDGKQARLVGTVRIDALEPAGPELVDLTAVGDRWKFATVKQTGDAEIVDELITRFGMLSGGAWDEPSRGAIVLPIAMAGQKQLLAGFLVLGISPRLAFDDEYRGFFDLVASNIATAIANARAYEAERKRAEALAELDRAKTTFFSNVSHEFRTPLTLMLAPLEDTIANLGGTIPPQEREQLQLVQRNGMRLLKLVNSLLDFSRIEARRVQAAYEPIDLATYTAELASSFRSLIERARMSLIVDCPTLPEAIYVDREMWEKIVLNLLSNAFKFTLTGTITVRLQCLENNVKLTVSDTGVGIPPEELPHLFERFHRIKNSQGRSFEGSGIGLSLVQELVKLHSGTIDVSSTFGQGSSFTVTIPTGTAHLLPERIRASRTLASTALGAMPYIEEAQRWLPEGDLRLEESSMAPSTHELVNQPAQSKIQNLKSKILLADDNADMRDYIRRLLSGSYTVETVADGVAALSALENNPPDLVLSDVMMPGMDGFELLRSLRSNPATQDIPVILLSARAGEESRIEGLEAGADDYLIKPFSARELLARVEASLNLGRLRQEATVRERTLLGRVTDAFMAMDLDFRFTYANEAAQRVSRTPLEALLGKTMWESFPGTVGAQFEFQYRRSLSEQIAVDFEEYYAPLDLWVEIHVYPSPTGLSLFFRDINDRKRAELNAEFLANISQDLVGAMGVDEIVQTVGEQLNRYLNTSNCAFVKINEGAGLAAIDRDWHQNDVPSLVGVYSMREFVTEEFLQAAKAGEPMVVRDFAVDGRIVDPQRYAALKIGAQINVPLIRDGEWKFSLVVFHQAPYDWRPDEIELMRELANRIWAKLERARAEAALRESEEKYRSLFDSMDEGYILADVVFDADDRPIDIFYLEANPAVRRLTGLDLVGRRLRELDGNYESHWWETFGRVARTGAGERQELYAEPLKAWYNLYVFKAGDADSYRVAAVFQDVTERKKIERERERFLAVGSDLQVITGINGYFHWVSPTFERTLGWTPEEMTSRPWTEFVHPEDLGPSIAETDSLFCGNKTFTFENRYRHKDGSYRWLLWNAQPYPEEQVIYGAAVDITDRVRVEDDRQRAEQALREIQEQSRNILESIAEAFLALDRNWRFTYVNQAAETLLDRTAGDLIGKNLWEEYPGLIGNEFEPIYRSAMDRTPGSLTAFYPDHDRWYEVRMYPAAQGITVYFRNVTERKQTEEALRESEELKQRILESSKDCIKVLTLDSEIVYISTGGLCLLEIDDPTLIRNTRWLDIWQGEHYENASRAIAAAKAGNTGQFQGYLPTRKGTPKWWDSMITPLRNTSGQVSQLVAISRDITKQKQAEAEREKLLQQEQAAREAAETANRIKDEFLAVLSHELRSPLNPILGWSKLLQQSKLDAAKTASALATIERNARLQSQLIDDLLDISRILSGKLSLNRMSVDLNMVISAALETVRLAAEAKSLQIQTTFSPSQGMVIGDSGRLQQVIWNLLSNAVKFTPEGGQITVRLTQTKTYAQIQVIDTGKGINPEFLPYVFEHFRQEDGATTRKFGGLGLGLAIARQIVELHGGRIWVQSRGEGQGATFTVELPVLHTANPIAVEVADTTEARSDDLHLASLRVLVVDDEQDSRDFVAFVAQQEGAEVTAVGSAIEALQLLSTAAFDILLSDIGMPDMDGYMLVRKVRALPPEQGGQIPAIALTAYAGDFDRKQALAAGFQRHVTKPVEPNELVRAIVTLL
ncbi:ATP-binding protein [Microcoleus sp. ARI1-B5]|uniref:ATP-binding protein n=1 Tax=unclassified Microcoleus TaxID=2642155 RepID=UPI002FCF1B7D